MTVGKAAEPLLPEGNLAREHLLRREGARDRARSMERAGRRLSLAWLQREM
jgi:hypothetical protein